MFPLRIRDPRVTIDGRDVLDGPDLKREGEGVVLVAGQALHPGRIAVEDGVLEFP